MNIIQQIQKYDDQTKEKGFLVQQDLFFDKTLQENCRFVLDEPETMQMLHNFLDKIKIMDKTAQVYVSTYPLYNEQEKPFLYADTLWIDTEVSLEEIAQYFADCRVIEPSSIDAVTREEIQEIDFVFTEKVMGCKKFFQKKNLERIKSLYWD